MSQSLSNVLVHAIFSTKDRRPFLKDRAIRKAMHEQLGSVSQQLKCPPIQCGGVEDHIHLLAHLSRTITIADWVKELKRVTSKWIKEQYPRLRAFQWQRGYGVFSVNQSSKKRVVVYIRDQEGHHHDMDFKTEYRRFLEVNGIEFDERYVWD